MSYSFFVCSNYFYSDNIGSLEKLELKYLDKNLFFDSQNILRFLKFLSDKFVKLKSLTLEFVQFISKSEDSNEVNLIPPSRFLEMHTVYESNLDVQSERTKIKLNYLIDKTYDFPKTVMENYSEELKKKLQHFIYSPRIENNETCHNFKRSSHVLGNFELNIKIFLDCNSVLPILHRIV